MSATVDDANAELKLTVLEKFMAVRGLTVPKAKVKGAPVRLTAEALSKTYTKRRTGKQTAAQREALREPMDILSESVDAYVPRKRKQQLMNLHQDENEVNEEFLKEARELKFEREVLDKDVCDREENRYEFEEKLWQLMVEVRGLQEVEDEEENQDGEDTQATTSDLDETSAANS